MDNNHAIIIVIIIIYLIPYFPHFGVSPGDRQTEGSSVCKGVFILFYGPGNFAFLGGVVDLNHIIPLSLLSYDISRARISLWVDVFLLVACTGLNGLV